MSKSMQQGLTLLEIMFAFAILAIGIVGVVASINSGMLARADNRELVIAINAAREKYEELCEVASTVADFNALFNNYKYGTTNNTFDVEITENGKIKKPLGIPKTGNRNNKNGWIDFPVANLGDSTLDETISSSHSNKYIALLAKDLGMPRDLDDDGDDTADNTAVGDDENYEWLPIRITIRWGGNGRRIQEYKFSSVIYKPAG